MSTESETGWPKEWPKETGFYWARETPNDMNILLVEVHRNRLTICGGTKLNVKEAFEDSEFLGPITPADRERLVRLEKALLLHVDRVDDGSIHSKTCARVRGGMCTTPSRCLMVSELLRK